MADFPQTLSLATGLFYKRADLCAAINNMSKRLKREFPPVAERTVEALHRRHMYAKIVPYCDQMNSVFVHNVLVETRISYEPLDAVEDFWLPRLDDNVSANERRCVKLIYEDLAMFGSTDREKTLIAAEAFMKRAQRLQPVQDAQSSLEEAIEKRASRDPFLPTCDTRCAWSNNANAADIACIGRFTLTLQLDMRYYHFAGVDRESLECFLRDTVLRGRCLCLVAPYMAGEKTFAVRIRLRYCRELGGNTASEVDEYTLLRQKERQVHMALLQGPRNARNASIERLQLPRYSSEGKQMQDHLYISTRMRNVQYAMGLADIDFRRLESNIIPEVYRVLGIRAARAAIVRELEEMSASGGCNVDRHYIALIADTMCASGEVLPFTYSGVCRMHNDYAIHTTYEQQSKTMVRAAQNQASIPVVSPDASIDVGQRVAHMGTNSFDVFLDHNRLINATAQNYLGQDKPHLKMAEKKRKLPKAFQSHAQSPRRNGHLLTAQSPLPVNGDFSPIRKSEGGAFLAENNDSMQMSPVYLSSTLPPAYSPSSPTYSPPLPIYSPSSPTHHLTSPVYSPSSPVYDQSAAVYSPSSPVYEISSPMYDISSPAYSE